MDSSPEKKKAVQVSADVERRIRNLSVVSAMMRYAPDLFDERMASLANDPQAVRLFSALVPMEYKPAMPVCIPVNWTDAQGHSWLAYHHSGRDPRFYEVCDITSGGKCRDLSNDYDAVVDDFGNLVRVRPAEFAWIKPRILKGATPT